MSDSELQAFFQENPFVLVYFVYLFVGSFISIIALRRINAVSQNIHPTKLRPWPIRGLDFGIFITSLAVWFVFSGVLFFKAYTWIYGAEAEIGSGGIIVGGLLLQAGMLSLFIFFKLNLRSIDDGPVNARLISTPYAAGLGYLSFFASLPIILIVGAVWTYLLSLLSKLGIEINLPLQDAVELFLNMDNPYHLAALIFLAVIIAPIVEESVFRAGIFRYLKGKMALFPAILLSGTMFGIVHGNLQSLPGLIAVGSCLAFAYEKSGNIKVSMFFHAFFNLNSIILMTILPRDLV